MQTKRKFVQVHSIYFKVVHHVINKKYEVYEQRMKRRVLSLPRFTSETRERGRCNNVTAGKIG